MWMLLPFSAAGSVAQDAVPYVVAGRLVTDHPDDVYPDPPDPRSGIHERYASEYCHVAGVTGPRCDAIAVAYLATPLALPFAIAIGHLSGETASVLMRLGAATLLAGGMLMIWERLAHRTRHARMHLLGVAVASTPMAATAIGFAQTSPLMFLSVCLGLSATTRLRKALSVLVWVGACVFKAFPAALVLVAAWLRRWRFLAAAAVTFALLAIVTFAIAPTSIIGDFIASSSTITGGTVGGSVDALVQQVAGSGSVGRVMGRVVAVLAALGCCWVGFKRTDADTRWAAGYVALLLVSPLVQVHYLWVMIGALAVAIGAQRQLGDRELSVITLASIATIPPSLVSDPTKGAYPTYQAIFLVVTAVIFGWLAMRSRSPYDTATSPITGYGPHSQP